MERFDALMDARNVLDDLMGTADILDGVIDSRDTSGDAPVAANTLGELPDTTSTLSELLDTTGTLGTVMDTTDSSGWVLDATPTQKPLSSGRSSDRLCFHSVHSSNIWVSRDGSLALRVWSDTNPGVAFSSRPLGLEESVCLRVVEESSNCKFGVIRLGISTEDPSALPNPAPEYSTSYWTTTLDHPLRKNDIFSFFFNSTGHIRLRINGKHKGLAFPKLGP